MKILITGSNGLIGSDAVEHYDGQGHEWMLNFSLREIVKAMVEMEMAKVAS